MAAVLMRALDVVTSICGPFNQIVKAITCHYGEVIIFLIEPLGVHGAQGVGPTCCVPLTVAPAVLLYRAPLRI